MLLAGIGLFTGSVLARTVAVIVAMISIILSFLWLPYYPWWSVLIIAFDFVVIWALTFEAMMWLQGHHIDFDQRITPVASDTSTTTKNRP